MTTAKTYDRLNRLLGTNSANHQPSTLSYINYHDNSANRQVRATLADGYWVYAYDKLGQVTNGKRYWADGGPLAGQPFEYGYDDIGNRVGEGSFLEKLRSRLAEVMRGRRRESHSGGAKAAHDEAAAAAALAQGLAALGLEQSRLARMPKGVAEKAVLAWWLRQRTTVGLRWLSERLGMGHLTRVSQAVSQVQHGPKAIHQRLQRRLARAERATGGG